MPAMEIIAELHCSWAGGTISLRVVVLMASQCVYVMLLSCLFNVNVCMFVFILRKSRELGLRQEAVMWLVYI